MSFIGGFTVPSLPVYGLGCGVLSSVVDLAESTGTVCREGVW